MKPGRMLNRGRPVFEVSHDVQFNCDDIREPVNANFMAELHFFIYQNAFL